MIEVNINPEDVERLVREKVTTEVVERITGQVVDKMLRERY